MQFEVSFCGFSYAFIEDALRCFVFALLGFAITRVLSPTIEMRRTTPRDAAGCTASLNSNASSVRKRVTSRVAQRMRYVEFVLESESKLCPRGQVPPCGRSSPLVTLPVEITSLLVTFVDLADVAQLSAASRRARDGFWHAHQVWVELSIARGLQCSVASLAEGAASEHFRRKMFRITDEHARSLLKQARNGCAPSAQVLEEAAHMLRGLMPQDGQSTLSCVLESAADAIWLHESWNERSVHAVELFFQVLRRRTKLLSPAQFEHLQDCLSTVQSLNASAESEIQKMCGDPSVADLEESDYWPDQPL